MGRISRIFERRGQLTNPDDFLREALGVYVTATGKSVSPKSSLQSTAVYRAIWLISMAMAALPVRLYERLQEGRREALDHPLFWLLHDEPNPEIIAPAFYSTLQGHVEGWGNAYAEIQFNGAGQPVALWPLRPDHTEPVRVGPGLELDNYQAGDLLYETRLPGTGQVRYLPAYRVLHVPNFGFNGLIGYSSVRMMREAIALGMAAEEYGGRFFGNDATPKVVLKHPRELKQAARDNLRESWEIMHQGLANKHRIGILEEGIDIAQIGLSNEDSQFLETRKFQVVEVARIFGVPPHLLYDLDRSTFNNIEQQGIEFKSLSMAPRLVFWESAMKKKLLFGDDRRRYYVKFGLDGLLRGDFKTRQEGYAIGRQWGTYNADEIRALEDMNPLPNGQGKKYYMPVNMVPTEFFDEPGVQAPAAQEPAQDPDKDPDPQEPPAQASSSRRSARRSSGRAMISRSYRRIFSDAAGRIYKREHQDVLAAARKHLGQRAAGDFEKWLEDYYAAYAERASRDLAPGFYALGDAIHAAAAEEIGVDPDQEAQVQAAIQTHIDGVAQRMAGRSKAKIKELLASAEEEAFLDDLDSMLGSWEESKPDRLALWETVRTAGMVAGVVWAAKGILTQVWRAGPDACPFCQELDGTVVSIGSAFVNESDTLEAGGGSLSPGWSATSPPIHDGCECDIAPG